LDVQRPAADRSALAEGYVDNEGLGYGYGNGAGYGYGYGSDGDGESEVTSEEWFLPERPDGVLLVRASSPSAEGTGDTWIDCHVFADRVEIVTTSGPHRDVTISSRAHALDFERFQRLFSESVRLERSEMYEVTAIGTDQPFTSYLAQLSDQIVALRVYNGNDQAENSTPAGAELRAWTDALCGN
jgi:hypothetical protein